ncbi:MAG: helix-turn-helix transcriptional regulator [Pontiellaceae bacterium]|nr:helix-turn-helix transcriptional regulator [Pontiellaceae bacterium]MBN2785705.1 helix-turn-helix transcriptional regulator [Pontiellaceae bacterium]
MTDNRADFISTQVSSGEYYYLNLTPNKHDPETVVCGGREQCTPEYRIERSGFKFSSIEFVAAGRGRLTLHGSTVELRPGMIFYYGPRTPHIIETDPEFPLLKHFVSFTGSALTRLIQETVFHRGIPLHASRPFRLRSIFENLMTTGNTPSRNRNTLCALLLRQLILLADDTATDAATAASASWQTYLRCRQYMERNYLEIESVHDAAQRCHVDQAYLARLFKRFAEETPLQLLNRLKMNRAAELLGNHDMLVKEVGEAVGFVDPYHFSRVFKRVFGIPPETFTRVTRRSGQ